MEIIIPLPTTSASTYKELNGYLKQFELAIHHAQKAVNNAEETGIEITEDSFVCFKFPSISDEIETSNYEELQSIELQINLK